MAPDLFRIIGGVVRLQYFRHAANYVFVGKPLWRFSIRTDQNTVHKDNGQHLSGIETGDYFEGSKSTGAVQDEGGEVSHVDADDCFRDGSVE